MLFQLLNIMLFLILVALPMRELATVPDGSCPAGGSTCDTLEDNSKVLQDVLEVQGCCTHPDCPAVPNNGECQHEMASALQPCLQKGEVGISKEVCVMEKLLALGSVTAPKCSNIGRRCEAIAMLVHVSILTAQLPCPKPGSEAIAMLVHVSILTAQLTCPKPG